MEAGRFSHQPCLFFRLGMARLLIDALADG
jgi:hypothetical protein